MFEDEEHSHINMFSPTYGSVGDDCLLCTYEYLPEYADEIGRFGELLESTSRRMGCGTRTCVELLLSGPDSDFPLMATLPESGISDHFDRVFGRPTCGYNRSKRYDFFTLFDDETNVDGAEYVRFVLDSYKHARTTSLCPYALLAVYVHGILSSSIGGVSEFKKKHDYLWMYACLAEHGIRLGKLR
jgi:hypothetical protein